MKGNPRVWHNWYYITAKCSYLSLVIIYVKNKEVRHETRENYAIARILGVEKKDITLEDSKEQQKRVLIFHYKIAAHNFQVCCDDRV